MIEFKQKFIEDASDLLNELEQNLLNLENSPNNSQLIEEIFRAMHTLKGTAGMYGFKEMGNLTHQLENIYDLVRNGRITINKSILDITLQAVDFLNKALKANESENFEIEYDSFYSRITAVLALNEISDFDGNRQEIENIVEQSGGMHTWLMIIKPISDLRKRGIKMHVIFDDIAAAGKNHIFNRNVKLSEGSSVYWEIILATELPQAELEDILLFIIDICTIELLADENLFEHDFFQDVITELANVPNIDTEILKEKISGKIHSKESDSDKKEKIEATKIESIKVSSERLDEQMVLLSELVTAKAELQLIVEKSGYKNLLKTVEQIEKITRRLRRNIFKIRLVALENLQLRFDRLIRDLSKQLHKDVIFTTEGMHTELDKTIIDSLESPIMHLMRNCLDHGIETAELRKMRGKPGKGLIKLSARQNATNVFITVTDDGEGINVQRIKEKAIQKGIININDELTESQIHDLIFTPGFSTAQNLTEVSGRGVGMDVVKQTVNHLRGAIEVYSEKGKGTSFTIKLPLTLSIVDTMLVKCGNMFYAIPISIIEKCTELNHGDLNNFDNKFVKVDGSIFPYIIINDILTMKNDMRFINKQTYDLEINTPKKSSENKKLKIVIVRKENTKIALIVDEVIGEHQAVLKPLGEYFKTQPYISGASQLADGRIALVLDTTKLNIEN